MTPVVRLILIANVLVFGLQQISADELMTHFALWPLGLHMTYLGEVGFEPWQLLTSAFLHGSLTHIAFNMFALYSFGVMVERAAGARRQIEKEGPTSHDRFGQLRGHPLLAVERDARGQFLMALKALNLDLEPVRDRPGRPGGR